MSEMFDVVIRHGLIIDGSGGAPFAGDVGIRDGRIMAVGQVAERGAQEIDATGKIVTPGFVDIHTHYDGQITWENRLSPSSNHGVTTVLMGNCGVGFAPCRPEHRDMLIQVMEGVEDIPEIVMTTGMPWNWVSFPDYLDVLDQREADIDFATQVPHSAVRVYVMGKRGAEREPATSEDLAEMRRLVSEGIKAGALGVSTSQSHSHRRVDGEYAPSVDAEQQELVALAGGLADAGAGVYQIIPNLNFSKSPSDPRDEMQLFRRLVETSGRPLSFSMVETKIQKGTTEAILEQVAEAQRDGFAIRPQVFPRAAGVLLGLELSYHPFSYHPVFKEIEDLPLAEKVKTLRDPEFRARLLSDTPTEGDVMYQTVIGGVGELYPMGNPPNYEPHPDTRLKVRAEREGTTAAALALDAMLENGGRGILMMPATNFVSRNLDTVRTMITDPNSLLALGDGGAHYGLICDSSFTTFMLTHWVRDRPHGRVPLEWAVRKLSHEPACAVGLADRGLLQPGYKADINVIDLEQLQLHPPQVDYDLPAGGRRLSQRADGIDATIVSGVITYRNGNPTGALPGRLVRGARTAPVDAPALALADA